MWDEEHSKIFTRIPSNRPYEEYTEYIGHGLAVAKPETQNITWDADKEGFTTRLYNITYALGYMVSMESMQDNNWGPQIKRGGKALATSFRQTEETVAGLILSRAFNSSYTGADGLELCSTAHVNRYDGTTYSNELATPLDLSELAIEQLAIQIEQQKNERGLPMKLKPQMLIIDPSNIFNAERIVKSTLQNDSADNAINAIRSRGLLPKGYMVSHYYSAGNGAFFITTDGDGGLVYQDRLPFTPDQDNEFDNKNAKFSAVRRAAWGWNNPRVFFGSAGAA